MKQRLIKIISELLTVLDENYSPELSEIIDDLERIVLDMDGRALKSISVFVISFFIVLIGVFYGLSSKSEAECTLHKNVPFSNCNRLSQFKPTKMI